MNKAFIFDMDGVLIDTERTWAKYTNTFLPQIFGQEISDKLGSLLGMKLDQIYDKAVSFGFTMDKKEFHERFDKHAEIVYAEAAVTEGLDELAQELDKYNFNIGLVSASKTHWIQTVLSRISFADKFDYIISMNDRPDLNHKPHPDGYLEAIQKLGASPETTIILEDSNTGIQAGKAAGATVIGFKQNLIKGYKQTGADVYAENIEDVIQIVKRNILLPGSPPSRG